MYNRKVADKKHDKKRAKQPRVSFRLNTEEYKLLNEAMRKTGEGQKATIMIALKNIEDKS